MEHHLSEEFKENYEEKFEALGQRVTRILSFAENKAKASINMAA